MYAPEIEGLTDADPNIFQVSQQREADKNLLVKFFLEPKKDKKASVKEGRPIYRETEYIDIKVPGNRNTYVCRPVSDIDRNRFPEHYKAFKDRTDQNINEGTPLAEWPMVSRSLVQELAFFHVHTVEQLATMADGQAAKFMGLSRIREKAKIWLETAKNEKPLWEMEAKIKTQAAEISELKEALNQVIQRVDGADEAKNEPDLKKKRQRTRAVRNAKKKAQ